jgi:hypothetical protein
VLQDEIILLWHYFLIAEKRRKEHEKILKASQSVHHIQFILCYTLLCDFASLKKDESSIAA